jgi:SEC-C motif-containing protein
MTSPIGTTQDCPCGSGWAYSVCCGPLHDGQAATTAERLMRSRYSAYALGRTDYVFRTWHPRTRPDDVENDTTLTWEGLEVLRTEDGGADDHTGGVEFRASYRTPVGAGAMHETSRFERRAGRWVYVDGDVEPTS